MANPMISGAKQFVHDLIGVERYAPHEPIIEQIARTSIHNDRDYDAFGKFVAEVFEAGYMKSAEDHAVELSKMGMKVSFKRQELNATKESNPIFNQRNRPADS